MEAIKSGNVEKLKGFGTKTVQNIKEGLAEVQKSEKRIFWAEALDIVDYLKDKLNDCKEIQQLEFAGSIRRMKPTIGDIDILATARDGDRKKVLDYFVSLDDTKKILAHGDTKANIIIDMEDTQVDFRLVNQDE